MDELIRQLTTAAPLYFAAVNGHLKVVQTLLKDGRADPTAMNSRALRKAAEFGHSKVVQELLKDGRADPAADNQRSSSFCC